MTNLKPLRLHSTSSLSSPIDVTLTSTKLCGPSGAGFSGWARYRRSRASVISFSAGKQSQTLVIRCLQKLWTRIEGSSPRKRGPRSRTQNKRRWIPAISAFTRVFDALCAGMNGPACRTVLALLHLDQSDLIDQAVRGHRVAVARHAHVAHDVAAAGDRPALEFLRLRVEAHDRVRLGAGFVVPERALGEDDAVGLRLRPARRWPFLVLAGRKIEPPQIAAREIRVPDRVVGRERETARTRCRVRQRVLLDRRGVGIDGRDLVDAELDKDGNALRVHRQAIRP